MEKNQISQNYLNIVQLQEELDGILFNYIDTLQKWEKAFEELKRLLEEITTYFKNYVESKNGQLPENEMYWSLFMDIVSKIIYFKTVAYLNLVKDLDEEQKTLIKNAFHDAANCLPNVQGRNKEFLQEIGQTYHQLFDDEEFERIYLEKNKSLKECLEFFKGYCGQKMQN